MKQKFLLLMLQAFVVLGLNAEVLTGSCGTNLTYNLDTSTGVLKIEGSGKMWDYSSSSSAPWYAYRTSIVTLNLSESLTSIGRSAFRDCSGLTSVTIPNSVTSIGDHAFYECSGLTSVTIPNSVTSIGKSAFEFCSGLISVTIPNSVTSIGEYAFFFCSGLTSVTIPNSVTSIGDGAFYGCTGLTSVTIPNSVTSIGEDAFSDCSGLTSVTIPNSVTSIGNHAFDGCSSLTSVTIPNSVTSIGNHAFGGCTSLISFNVDAGNEYYSSEENVLFDKVKATLLFCVRTKKGSYIIPNSVTSIGKYAFEYSSLTSVTIPNSVTSIGEYAFEHSFLTSVTIPNSVTSTARGAFYNCSNIKIINWNANIDCSGFGFEFLRSIKEIIIGDDVTTVYPFSVVGSYLNKVVLGKSVQYVRQNAFQNFNGDFYVYSEEAPYLYPDVFENATLSSSTLYVPASKASYYKTTAPWNEFGKILDLEGNEPDITQKQCAKPSIAYEDGKLYFATATPGATIYSNVASSDIKSATGTEVALSGTYTITAVAKRSEYLDSDPATATLHWIEATFESDGIAQALSEKRAVLVSSSDGFVTITGLNDGEMVDAYTTDGKHVTTTRAIGNSATITAPTSTTLILKIADERIKVNVR